VEALRDAIPQLVRRRHVPGLNLAVARAGRVIWEASFGYADLGRRLPMELDTVTRSGSMCKTYTATSVMQLVEHGVVGLDAPINDYLDFPVINPLGAREVSVRDLLTHRSGLFTDGASSSLRRPRELNEHLRDDFARGTLDYFHGSKPKWTAAVGERFQYSNTGIAVLGLIVQRANPEGLSFSEYVQRHVIDLLGMTSTQFPPVNNDPEIVRPDILERVSTGYAGWGTLRIASPQIHFANYPAGLVLTIPRDHVRVLLAYLAGGTLNDRRLLEETTIREMLAPQAETPGTIGDHIGLVWLLRDVGQPTESFGHAGGHMWGWITDYRAFPRLDLAIAVFTNQWDMGEWQSGTANPSIAEHIAELAAATVAGHRPSTHSWAWKRSYLIGLSLAVATQGACGIDEPFSPEQISAMVDCAYPGADELWDDGGFRTALRDIEHAEFTLEGLERFFASDRCQLSRPELDALWLDAGGTGGAPFAGTLAEQAFDRVMEQPAEPNGGNQS
jgi:CubicO group peptidase (beta-lactamase class C family)